MNFEFTVTYELLSAADRDGVVAEHLRRRLAPLGLVEVTTLSWIDGSKPPVRRMFQLQLLKGAAIKACWGFSLDFVPHISAGRVRWHRSSKSARLDVIVDPKDMPQASYLRGHSRLDSDLERLMPEAIKRAESDWKRGATLAGMLDLVRYLRDSRSNCFGYQMYTQLPLAFAFLSAKVGDKNEADQALTEYIERFELDDDEASKLQRAAWA